MLDAQRIGDKEIHGAIIRHRALPISVFIPFFRYIKAFSVILITERSLDFDPAGIVFINQANGDRNRRIVPASRDFRVQLIIRFQRRRVRGFRWDRGFFRLRRGFRRFLCTGSLGRRFFCGFGFYLQFCLHNFKGAVRRGIGHVCPFFRKRHAGHGEKHQHKAEHQRNHAEHTRGFLSFLQVHFPYPPSVCCKTANRPF